MTQEYHYSVHVAGQAEYGPFETHAEAESFADVRSVHGYDTAIHAFDRDRPREHLLPPYPDGFDGCPHCGRIEGYAFIGTGCLAYCKTHRTKWLVQAGMQEASEDDCRHYEETGLREFAEV
jgi:hypothetical protein